jgi:hypothetical protein
MARRNPPVPDDDLEAHYLARIAKASERTAQWVTVLGVFATGAVLLAVLALATAGRS